MNRTGSARETIAIASVLLFVVVAWISATMLLSEFRASNDAMGNPIPDKYLEPAANALTFMDNGIVFVAGAMYLAAILFAFRIPTSPIFFFPSFIFLMISTWITAEFSNVFWKFVNAGGPVTQAANQYDVLITLMKSLPYITFGFGAIILIAMFIRLRTRNTGVVGA